MRPTLYDYVLSPSCYKARLMAALVGSELESVAVDFHPGGDHRKPEFLMLNPAGTLPVLTHGGLILTETTAMLVYLVRLAGRCEWLGGEDPASAARVQQWLAFSARLTASLGLARLHDMLGRPADIDAARWAGTLCLRELESALVENRLLGEDFLAGNAPTVADVACFPYVMLAPDGGVSLDPYPAIRAWTRRIRALPGFVEMPGIHRLHDLRPEPGEAEAAA
ncbi:glutathione S-transferase family protein [Rubellimicrobium rubrum]|uniref:Glutathione S-transferase family protein n=1 Tax=Rubellimicrobium rubrum TaxID=2585369 RepID=A0A5C4N2F6_9RHOB|nr:glutathione S-transferase N-terminal domain-containing protein [Rubellimicrobium rubrum]TNC51619.1 glutathione S-transferase family protein [Rubellimicrobium rubrum]